MRVGGNQEHTKITIHQGQLTEVKNIPLKLVMYGAQEKKRILMNANWADQKAAIIKMMLF